MMFMSYSAGQIVAPHFFLSSEAPRYPTGFRAFYVTVALMIVIEIVMMYVSISVNASHDFLTLSQFLPHIPEPEEGSRSSNDSGKIGGCSRE
jgi:hypothetical protein